VNANSGRLTPFLDRLTLVRKVTLSQLLSIASIVIDTGDPRMNDAGIMLPKTPFWFEPARRRTGREVIDSSHRNGNDWTVWTFVASTAP